MRIVIINCVASALGTIESAVVDIEYIRKKFNPVDIRYYETNEEGVVIDLLHNKGFEADGIILSPGRFRYTSVSIGDAIAGISSDVIVVGELTDLKTDLIDFSARKAIGCIRGFGNRSYELGVEYFLGKR